MAMKTILVPIPDTAVNTPAIEIALMVAKAVAGHVEGLYIETPPPITYHRPSTAADAKPWRAVGRSASVLQASLLGSYTSCSLNVRASDSHSPPVTWMRPLRPLAVRPLRGVGRSGPRVQVPAAGS